MIKIYKYNENYINIWTEFVNTHKFSTIYHTRNFLEYHPSDRFEDHSILMYDNSMLIAVMPCCKRNTKFFSYSGATYGGPIIHTNYTNINKMKIITDNIINYFNNNIEFRLANNIYFSEEINILYFLLSQKLKMIPELSWYITTEQNFLNNITNKRNKKYITKMIEDPSINCFITNDNDDYKDFYKILFNNLTTNHNTEPTHTLEEFLDLKNRLQDNACLFIVKRDKDILGGVYVIKVTNICWYTFYISKNIDFNTQAILYAMYTIWEYAKENNVKYIDYGISTENCGQEINFGLSEYKEKSLGGIPNYRYLFLK